MQKEWKNFAQPRSQRISSTCAKLWNSERNSKRWEDYSQLLFLIRQNSFRRGLALSKKSFSTCRLVFTFYAGCVADVPRSLNGYVRFIVPYRSRWEQTEIIYCPREMQREGEIITLRAFGINEFEWYQKWNVIMAEIKQPGNTSDLCITKQLM